MPLARPRFNASAAEAAALDIYGLRSRARELPSYSDQNFRLTAENDDEFVLKIFGSDQPRGLLELQIAIWRRLDAYGSRFRFPLAVAAAGGEEINGLTGVDGSEHLTLLLRWMPGTPLAAVRPHPVALLYEVGELVGTVAAALDGFTHPAADRTYDWDQRQAPKIIRRRLRWLDGDRQALVGRILERYEETIGDALDELPTAVLHNDPNDHNIVLGEIEELPGELPRRRVAGLIDFGDVVVGPRAIDPAVAMAYAMAGCRDPLAIAGPIVAGYREVHALEEAEIEALLPMALMRLCLSVCHCAEKIRAEPDNEYLRVSEQPAWDLLERLAPTSWDLAHYRLRAACGLEPCPRTTAVVSWLSEQEGTFAPVVEPALTPESAYTFDLSVGSLEAGGGAPGSFDVERLTATLFGRLKRHGRTIGIGRYDEARNWYGGELFAAAANEAPARRSVHLGIDLFLESGAPVFAPLDGWVASVHDNDGRLDYGPTVVLGHRPADGILFFTLYGHLMPGSLDRLQLGRPVKAGARIGSIGDFPDNGDWPPHLHFQLIVDRLDHPRDFPGVASPEERPTWLSLSPDPNLLLGMPASLSADPHPAPAEILDRRRDRIGPSVGLLYRRPLNIVRGYRQFLYDEMGRPFLDAVNNVPHVGHSHPRVVAAVARQSAVLNTNTRYLHESLVRYAERLTAELPAPLSVCYLVSSGSEANELALRIARTVTGRRRVAVVDGAYHGNTTAMIDLSPYKHNGPGGSGPPSWVQAVPAPDPYRGRFRGTAADLGERYAATVAAACRAAAGEADGGHATGLAAFFVEPLLGCGGQIVPPPGYLEAAFAHVRAAGGLCIADEVQIGLGRVGTHFSACEAQGAVPDILTLGKSIGNGFPLAAVVTTAEIATAFANGMEYFSTFGGNPVACAAGLAVLEVMAEEELQENSLRVGKQLLSGLTSLADQHTLIGDVRGRGLFLGVELVRDRGTLEPAAAAADYVVERLKDHGILLSTDGPLHNVLNIKPPLCFAAADAERLLETLGMVLAEDYLQPDPSYSAAGM